MTTYRTLPNLTRALGTAVESYAVQDHEDSTVHETGLTFDDAMDMVYARKGTYTVTNEKLGTEATYNYS